MNAWFDKRQPLWLPPGSVRALLAIWIVVLGTVYLMFTGGEIKDIVLIALGWYAIDKAYAKANTTPKE
jgi:hypothetical protein